MHHTLQQAKIRVVSQQTCTSVNTANLGITVSVFSQIIPLSLNVTAHIIKHYTNLIIGDRLERN